MNSILRGLRTHPAYVFAVLCVIVLCCAPFVLHAAGSLSVTVTPPLFQLSVSPGDSWSSTVKIVNNNDYDVTYYAHVVDMAASGEEGRSKFIPLINEPNDQAHQSFALARWITISPDPIVVPSGRSLDVPFLIKVPENAEPGGHYAAILIGTEPINTHSAGSVLQVSSYVSSLILLRIKGEIVESGRIREFSSEKSIYDTPISNFALRFENLGNTHIRPEGDVTIYNMWGKERGHVAINQDGNFGNVLPKSIRRFAFSWEGEPNSFDIGPYKAVVTLSYGEDGKKNVTASTYFWIVPVVPVSIALATVFFFVLLISWFIRRYIRRALELEESRARYLSIRAAAHAPQQVPQAPAHGAAVIETLIEPIKEGVIDLRRMRGSPVNTMAESTSVTSSHGQHENGVGMTRLSFVEFMAKYKLFFIFLLVLIALCFGGWWYLHKVLIPNRPYQIKSVSAQEESSVSH